MIVRLQTGIASSPRPRPRNRKFAAGRRRNAAEHVNSGHLEIVHAKFHDFNQNIGPRVPAAHRGRKSKFHLAHVTPGHLVINIYSKTPFNLPLNV